MPVALLVKPVLFSVPKVLPPISASVPLLVFDANFSNRNVPFETLTDPVFVSVTPVKLLVPPPAFLSTAPALPKLMVWPALPQVLAERILKVPPLCTFT